MLRFHAVRRLAVLALVLLLPGGCGDDDGGAGLQTDTTPPSTVIDLAVASTTDSSATLTWTAPGDDGVSGSASEYAVRYSNMGKIWDTATQVDSTAVPKTAGMPETLTVTGLPKEWVMYFALKAADEVPNWSEVSNYAYATTDTTPPATIGDLAVTASTCSSLTVAWTDTPDGSPLPNVITYDFRCSESAIIEANWSSATAPTTPPGLLPPSFPPDDRMGFLVFGLQPSTTYYFGLKRCDRSGNWSGLSNVASGTTLPEGL